MRRSTRRLVIQAALALGTDLVLVGGLWWLWSLASKPAPAGDDLQSVAEPAPANRAGMYTTSLVLQETEFRSD